MSYILDALRQSQQARERGQTPRLHQIHQFDDHRVPFGYWGMLLALGVASLALVIALLATLRPVEKSPPAPLLQRGGEATVNPSVQINPSLPISPPMPEVSAPVQKESSKSRPLQKGGWGDLIAPPPPKLRPKSPPAPLLQRGENSAVPVAKSVQPPAKKIAPLPPRRERTRAPDDLTKFDYPDPNLSPAQERELQRLLDGEQMPVDDAEIAAPARSAPPKSSPIPLDLIDDIEAFKQQIKREQGAKSHHE
ncbi:hypothetical protein [Chromatium okenii]|uniref:hypothetical protein n=1 Tax=Chromatium okenii TaxID=61644 RepID=UPI0026EFCF02|nr:hypothetical protein [Chromatium okenii]MBV5309971.1 hypothetical protein [Chromatium okenii]